MDLSKLEQHVEKASALLKAMANEKRLMIVCTLSKSEKNVGELEQLIGLSQSALSQHLSRLRRDGIVDIRREAQTIFYKLRDPAAAHILECLCGIYKDAN